MDAFVREGLRMFLFLGLKNDDDDRRDNQYQARGTVEAELLPEMQHHVTFSNEWTPAVPMQRMTFDHKIDLNKLSTIE